MSWDTPAPNWDTLAGRVLDRFISAVHESFSEYCQPLTVIGSAPIQLCLDEDFVSADVDVMVLSDTTPLRKIANASSGSLKVNTRGAYGVQVCPPQLFKSTPHYLQRAHSETRHGLRIIIPHVRDILIAKLHRSRTEGQEGLVIKDLRAFSRVRALCAGRPSAEDMLEDLILCEPEFRIPQDGSINDFRLNVLDLFPAVYGRNLDIASEIVAPSRLAEEEATYAASSVEHLLSQLSPDRD